ncbi:MAG TPA: hypothetical protein VFS32_08810 [Candidatus Limnocylindrales bacterium]|nr:hypothetical protein [Candidatus Limnocylindrales bacterium]
MSERPIGTDPGPGDVVGMGWDQGSDDTDEEPFDDALLPAERARMRRRDHDAAARERDLMNDGSAKWFKQALDRQERAAREARERRRAG